MERDRIIDCLRAHEAELRAEGAAALSLFGSIARGDEGSASDVDIAVALAREIAGLGYFSRMDALKRRREAILGRPVDLVSEPALRERLRQNINRDRAVAF